jgi:peptide/nickel transport system permease protein
MKFRIKVWHFLFFLFLVVLLLRISLLLKSYELMMNWMILFFDNPDSVVNLLNFSLVDAFASGILFVILPLLIILFRKKLLFLYSELSFASVILTLLVLTFLFAPLIANQNPDFYNNIGMTKLLPPLSSVKVLHFEEENDHSSSSLEKFLFLRDKVIPGTFNENIEYVDSISAGEEIVYYQNENLHQAEKQNIIYENGTPLVTKNIFWLGTDQFGRDIFTRLIYGARISLLVGFGAVIISLLLGLTFGFLAGYTGGILDTIFSRITDMFLSFPIIILVLLILGLFGNNILSVIVVLGFSGWMSLFKIVKTETLSVKNKNYFISARLLGLTKRRLLTREVLPVIIIPVVVNVIFQFGNVIIAESALSYLGLGLGENYPSWGSMIQSGQEYLSSAWWMIFFPGITLIFTLLAANSFGLSLNKKLNPRLQHD